MKILLSFSACILCLHLSSQASLDDLKFNVFQDLNSTANQNYIRLMNEQEEGEKAQVDFLFEEWSVAEVTSKKGETLRLDSLNYHVDDENMFFMLGGKMYFLYPGEVTEIIVDNRSFVPRYPDVKERAHQTYQYFELLVPGRCKLLKKYSVEKKKVNNHPMGISSGIDKYDYYSKTRLFYEDSESGIIQELPRSKKNIIRLFKRDRNRMVEYAREHNISPKSEQDMMRLFAYYNSLGD